MRNERMRYGLLCLLLAAATLLSACGGKSAPEPAHADLQALYDELLQLPDMPEMMPQGEKRIQKLYGIDPTACPQLVMAISKDGLLADEIWMIEAGSEEAAKELVALAESRVKQLCAELENYLPEQYAVAKKAQILQIGANMALFISPQAEEMAARFKQALGA